MKRVTIVLACAGILANNMAFAQSYRNKNKVVGSAAKESSISHDKFAWGLGLGMLAVLGIVVGFTAAAGSSGPQTFTESGAASSAGSSSQSFSH